LSLRSLVVSLDTSIGTSGRYDLRVAVGRLIFFKLSLPRYGVVGALHLVALCICAFNLEEWR
jgi:hypothetical protein